MPHRRSGPASSQQQAGEPQGGTGPLAFDRDCAILSVAEKPIEEVLALVGGWRSAIRCQVMAEVTRRDVRVARGSENSCLGADMLDATASGLHPTVAAAMSGTARRSSVGPRVTETYDRLYAVYRDLYPALRELFPRLADAVRS